VGLGPFQFHWLINTSIWNLLQEANVEWEGGGKKKFKAADTREILNGSERGNRRNIS